MCDLDIRFILYIFLIDANIKKRRKSQFTAFIVSFEVRFLTSHCDSVPVGFSQI